MSDTEPHLLAKQLRDWYNRLNEAVLGEVGISWEKYHKVLDEMREFIRKIEKQDPSIAGIEGF